jgi:hypothetical protein
MKKRTAPTEIGLGWYRREDWQRLLQMFPDRDKLHETYDEWLKDVHKGEKLVKREGNVVKRIIVDPDELAAWCALRGLQPVAAARAEYVCEKMQHESTGAEPAVSDKLFGDPS